MTTRCENSRLIREAKNRHWPLAPAGGLFFWTRPLLPARGCGRVRSAKFFRNLIKIGDKFRGAPAGAPKTSLNVLKLFSRDNAPEKGRKRRDPRPCVRILTETLSPFTQ